MRGRANPSDRGRPGTALALALLTALAAAIGFVRLRALPVFGDEAIFLRIAELVRTDPVGHLFSSLSAAAAPVHSWLLALALYLPSNAVWCGRCVSVLAGAAAVPVMAWTVAQLEVVGGRSTVRGSRPGPLLAAACVAVSPFFVSAARLARVDALFSTETILAAGASLWAARRLALSDESPSALGSAILFGGLMGVTMLTRTAVSYAYWALLPAALMIFSDRKGGANPRGRVWAALTVSLAVGLIALLPYVFAPGPEDLATRLFHYSAARSHGSLARRGALAGANLRVAAEALWTYLTPPLFIASVAAAIGLARPGRRRVLAFLAVWEGVALLPAVLFADTYFPRYALPAAGPFLAAFAVAAADILDRAYRGSGSRPRSRQSLRVGTATVLGALLIWPVRDVAAELSDWRTAPRMAIDRWQLVSGWTAGAAAERAVDFILRRAAAAPVIVLTPEISGNPTDSVWLELGGRPGVELAFLRDSLEGPLRPSDAERPLTWIARRDLLRGGALVTMGRSDPRSVLLVVPDPFLTRAGWRPASDVFGEREAGLLPVARFENPSDQEGTGRAGVVVFELQRGGVPAASSPE